MKKSSPQKPIIPLPPDFEKLKKKQKEKPALAWEESLKSAEKSVKKEIEGFQSENPPTFRIKAKGVENYEKLQKKMQSEFEKETKLMRDRVDVIKELVSAESIVQSDGPIQGKKTKSQESPTQKTEEGKFVFKKAGPGWAIVFEGKDIGHFEHTGFAYMHHCVKNYVKDADEGFSAIDLYRAVSKEGGPTTFDESLLIENEDEDEENKSSGVQITSGVPNKDWALKGDAKTLEAIHKELQNNRFMLDQAEERFDAQGIILLKNKRNKLLEEMGKYKWKSNKKIFSNDETKASAAVRKAISRALEALRGNSEPAYEHFSHAFKPISKFPKRYRPAKEIPWTLE